MKGLSTLLIGLALTQQAYPQTNHGVSHENHGNAESELQQQNQQEAPLLHHSGQSTFAAMIEITALLDTDKDTHWATVDLDALHSHLVDMNQLMLLTQSFTEILDDSLIQFTVTGTAEAVAAIHRMVPAHARALRHSRHWDITVKLTDKGAILQITADSHSRLTRLKALGFYGFMSLDSHHQRHHLNIALGNGH
ncbi:hypothetical protein ACUNV4_02190 [Granulosicoccus sp. 3-233]|uniref:hypothetical protein n=1 Tax=Granulosicoccus sp. 3-233 TaxID=3417969 RepID=UPI003D357689